jgi:hypothetical protein
MSDLETEIKKPVQDVLNALLFELENRVLPDEQAGIATAIDQLLGRLTSIVERIMSYEPIRNETAPAKSGKGSKAKGV